VAHITSPKREPLSKPAVRVLARIVTLSDIHGSCRAGQLTRAAGGYVEIARILFELEERGLIRWTSGTLRHTRDARRIVRPKSE
jgi:hypothetical protein